jgi:hypothetical protein
MDKFNRLYFILLDLATISGSFLINKGEVSERAVFKE